MISLYNAGAVAISDRYSDSCIRTKIIEEIYKRLGYEEVSE